MKRNALLVTAVLFCFAGLANAADHKKEPASQSQNPQQQSEMQSQYTAVRWDGNADARTECAPKSETNSKATYMQENPQGDSQASQNQVEYGGAG